MSSHNYLSRARTKTLQLSGNLRGMAAMVLAGLAITASFGMARHVLTEIHPFEVAFFRSLFGFLFLIPWLFQNGLGSFSTNRLPLHLVRSTIHVLGVLAFFVALNLIPLAEATALFFLAPIFSTVLAIIFLSEVVRLPRWIAIIIGFCGMLVIVRPGFAVVELGTILALCAACSGACGMLIMKSLARTDNAITITFYATCLMAPMLLLPASFFWTWPQLTTLFWLTAIGLTASAGQYLTAAAFRIAEVSVVTPLMFLQLFWAALTGFVFFGEVPDIFLWIGGSMIFGSIAFLAYREKMSQPSQN